MQTKRFIGENPKVGIRPVIDARQGGVRESLEEQTMSIAGRVAELITSTLKYTDGTPVQCVIADSTIGRVPEAAACAEKFRKEGVGLTISVTPSRRGLPCRSAGRSQPERYARIRHLRP